MNRPNPKCPSCRDSMQEGYVLEVGSGAKRLVSTWVEGAPEKSFWTGVNTDDRDQFPIVSFRCPTCGYLANFALKKLTS